LIAVVARTTRDLVDGRPASAGGVAYHAGRALRALGEPAVLVTRCAAEDGDLRAQVEALGLPVAFRAERVTSTFRITSGDGERSLSIEALGEPWTVEDVRGFAAPALAGADWVVAGALWRGDFPPDTLAELARGRRLALDAQGLVRPGRPGPVELDGSYDPALLAPVDVLHLSEIEAAALGLTLEAPSLAALGVPEVVVTLGARGSLVVAGGVATHVPARPLVGADATGAGDAFTAAYVAARRHGRPPAVAARRATSLVRALLAETLA
jgi:sugar/nucleoside kinase (ribokinase family)